MISGYECRHQLNFTMIFVINIGACDNLPWAYCIGNAIINGKYFQNVLVLSFSYLSTLGMC